jgi:hypothetical protein
MMTSLNQPLAPKQDLCPNPFGNRNVDSLSTAVLRMRGTQPVNQNLLKSPQISPLKMSSPLSQFKMISQEPYSPQEPYRTKSGRISKPPERLAFKALLEPYDYLEDDTFQDKHPLAFKAKE